MTAQAASHFGGVKNKGGDLLFRYGNPQIYQKQGAEQLLMHQHDAHWIEDGLANVGKIMLFNNEKTTTESAIEIIEPYLDSEGAYAYDAEQIWAYSASDFFSKYMSSAQRMPNGNVFICEGSSGHFFEINPTQEVVWDYINPVNSNGGPAIQGGTVRFNQTFRATKYVADYAAFLDKTLEGTVPVELNPWESDCYVKKEDTPEEKIELQVRNTVAIEAWNVYTNSSEMEVIVFDLMGQFRYEKKLTKGENSLDSIGLPSGVYVLIFKNKSTQFQIERVLKI